SWPAGFGPVPRKVGGHLRRRVVGVGAVKPPPGGGGCSHCSSCWALAACAVKGRCARPLRARPLTAQAPALRQVLANSRGRRPVLGRLPRKVGLASAGAGP